VTIAELMLAHLRHSERHYRRADGPPTDEVRAYKRVYKITRRLYGDDPAADFGQLVLKAVRQAMVEGGWCRGVVNQRIGRLGRIFKWAAGEELVPFEVYHRLTAVAGLQCGRTSAREAEPVKPVDEAMVEATLPFLNPHVRGLVEVERLTDMRPGEAVTIRRADIDTGGAVWLYRPQQHKMAYKNRPRTIAIGPKAKPCSAATSLRTSMTTCSRPAGRSRNSGPPSDRRGSRGFSRRSSTVAAPQQ
jgi:integrase